MKQRTSGPMRSRKIKMISMKKEVSAGVVIFRRTDSDVLYLILKYGWGHWGFVKGHIERGEKEIDTIKREAFEEAGITDLKFVFGFREKIEYDYFFKREKRHKIVYYYLAETSQGHVRLSYEHKDYAWLPYEEALRRITYESDRNILRKAHKYLKAMGII